jgi:hypothetical protein
MKEKRQVNTYWLLKAALCLVFFGFGAAKCDAQLGTPPIIAVQPLGISVLNGGTATLTTTAVSLTPMEFQWYFNNQKMTNPPVANVVVPLVGTISTLSISNASSANAGQYYVKVENGVGEVTSSSATLLVVASVVSQTLNILSTGTGMTSNGFNVQLSGPPGSNYVIEASTDLKNWAPISTNTSPSGSVSYVDTAVTNFPSRYYRARLQ